MNRYIPLWGCPSTLLSDNGPRFCAQLATTVYKLLGIRKLTASAYHPSGNGVQRTPKHVEYAYNNSISAVTGLAPKEFHLGLLPRLSLTAFDRSYGGGH